MKTQFTRQSVMLLLLVAALAAVPAFVKDNYLLRVAILILLNVVLAGGLNLINGYTATFHIGHAGFYCIGAYAAAILAKRYGLNFWLLLLVSGLLASAFSLLLGFPTLRLKGIFLTICTLGFSEIVRLVALNWTSLTRGPMGIPGVPFPTLFGMTIKTNGQFYLIILGLAVLQTFTFHRLINSRLGRAWIAIREDEAAARAMGIDAFRYKMLNFAIGTFWAGVAGCFYAFFASYVSTDSFKLDEGFAILAMVLVGGKGSLIGPIVGAVFLTVLPELFRSLVEYRLVIFGAAIVVTMLLRPEGIAGAGAFTRTRRRASPGPSPAAKGVS
ncbi:MAG: leucine/isoleucine/valine transporter permease subunit [Firmicutes bacterium ADurb.Bin506]|nr:MAG: leucine/isoleucine/valine transporter permease subunit [Firmicutes bacterium ADurb.Bin506]